MIQLSKVEAAKLMRGCRWREETILLLLKFAWIKSLIKIKNSEGILVHEFMILD